MFYYNSYTTYIFSLPLGKELNLYAPIIIIDWQAALTVTEAGNLPKWTKRVCIYMFSLKTEANYTIHYLVSAFSHNLILKYRNIYSLFLESWQLFFMI